MQGIVTDERGTKVKAAIVALLKVKDPEDESDTEIATYAETDEEGRFMIQDLNPDDKYFIEIHVDHARPEEMTLVEETAKSEPVEDKEVPEVPEAVEDTVEPEAPEQAFMQEPLIEEPDLNDTNSELELDEFEIEFDEDESEVELNEDDEFEIDDEEALEVFQLEADNLDPDDEMIDAMDDLAAGHVHELLKENRIIDSVKNNSQIDDERRKNICINNLYFILDTDLKDKLYLYRNI